MSRHRPENPDGGGLTRLSPCRHKQTIEFRHEQTGARACHRQDMRDSWQGVLARIKNVDETTAANYVDAVKLGIDEHIIGIAAGVEGLRNLAVAHRKDTEARRAAKDGQHLFCFLVERHGKMRGADLHRPVCSMLSGGAVYDRDLPRVRNIDKNATTFTIELEAFGMRLQSDVRDLQL